MCGRYVMARSTGDLVSTFDVDETLTGDLEASYNVAPTDEVPLILERPLAKPPASDRAEDRREDRAADRTGAGAGTSRSDTVRQLATARWGLVPPWSKGPRTGPPLINARIESVTEKPSFRKAAATRRALVVADGYYEWQKTGTGKIPTYLHGADGDILAFAGLYEYWPDPALPDGHPGKWLRTCTIITTAATDALGHIHDRTPVVVPRDLYADWLDPALTAATDVRQLLDAIPEPHLVPRVVSDKVNSVRNNGPELIEPDSPAGSGFLLPGME